MATKLSIRAACMGLCLLAASAACDPAGAAARRLITQDLDERQTVPLPGATRPEAADLDDLGPVQDDRMLEHMQLLLRRSPEREAALAETMSAQHDPASALYHRWLTAAEFGQAFGPAPDDIEDIAAWLRSRGFVVNGAPSGRMALDFSGSAGAVRAAFGTRIERLAAGGASHIAARGEAHIPAALAGAVRGIVSLSDFRPHKNLIPRPSYTFTRNGTTYRAVTPADLATIYNLKALFKAGLSGQGQTIAVIEDTDVYRTSDWTSFRSKFGLSGYGAGSLRQIHPAIRTRGCSDPGVVAATQSEAILDAEWASAAAPSATIELASCADTSTTFGGLIALQNLVDGSSPPAIISISYGECEALNGTAGNAAYSSLYQQAAAMGISVFVASGDEGAAGCDPNQTQATHGIGVNGLASTPYNVAVGGTDFLDAYSGATGTYWNATNDSSGGSARSYVPEIPWNNSCAGALLTTAAGYSTSTGPGGFCNSAMGRAYYLTTASGSGGPSGCATGSAATYGVVSGSCRGNAKPGWQSVLGNPADAVRDLPDLSLFAANGLWGHYYVYCDSDTAAGGASCSGPAGSWSGGGGTSFAAPILAGIQALVDQKQGSRQGNPNPVYYAIAASEYGKAGNSGCNSSHGVGASGSCVFYDVTQGDMDVNCTGSQGCYLAGGQTGALTQRGGSFARAFGTNTGWDFATGLGSVNAANLVNGWSAGLKLVRVR